jgi:hypothetical protein
MNGPRRPVPPAEPGGQDPMPLPRPRIDPLPPPPAPPFGPDDDSVLDPAKIAEIQQRAAATRTALRDVRDMLLRRRYGSSEPRNLTRMDGQWPFLLIRTYPGDVGHRPLPQDVQTRQSPDIIVTAAGPATEPRIVDRSGIAALRAREVVKPLRGEALDVWVHVWNLGHSQATGIRVRVRLFSVTHLDFNGFFLGGSALDLGDRLSAEAHRAVKVVTFNAPDYILATAFTVMAIAECLSDPAVGPVTPGTDRHAAHRFFSF